MMRNSKSKAPKDSSKELDYYMSLNYDVICQNYEDEGEKRIGLKIPDLPGVWASGKTYAEAFESLEETKKIWFETCLEDGVPIPEPISEEDFSGKFVLRIPKRLHMELSKQSQRLNISLNQYVKSILESTTSLKIMEIENQNREHKLLDEMQSIRMDIRRIGARLESLECAFGIMPAPKEFEMVTTASGTTFYMGATPGQFKAVHDPHSSMIMTLDINTKQKFCEWTGYTDEKNA